jgi:hypothetical protein
MIAVGGATFALVSVFFWQLRIPSTFTIPSWQSTSIESLTPAWLADGTSWPYALALAALAAAVIWTSVVRAENDPLAWAGTLVLAAFGIFAVTAQNPLTLVLVWSAIDLVELVILLRSTVGEQQNQAVIISFATRVAGTAIVLWAILVAVSRGGSLDFRFLAAPMGIYLLIASGLRLGVLPLHLPYEQENNLRRGFGTTLRLVSVAASLSLLSRIPPEAIASTLLPYLLVLAGIIALYTSWLWLRASDEIVGRPFWVLGMASLSVAASLRGNPTGSIGWGVSLVLCGGLIFLFSARQRSILWLPFLGLWGLSGLPFSPSASSWLTGNQISWLYILLFLPAQALLIAGFIRHALHPGETSLESQAKWVKVLYPTGLFILAGTSIILGLWGWVGAKTIGLWWASIAALTMAAGLSVFALTVLPRLAVTGVSPQWSRRLRLDWMFGLLSRLYRSFKWVTDLITSSLEGDGGVLWSLLLLALILSVVSTIGH